MVLSSGAFGHWPSGRSLHRTRHRGGRSSLKGWHVSEHDEVASARDRAEARRLVRDIARAVSAIERVVTSDGGGAGQISASRFHGDRYTPDLTRFCGNWPEGDGWLVRVSDANGRSNLYHDMWLSDAALAEDYQGEIDATAVGGLTLLRQFAEAAGLRLRPR
jgi:hypothetical protein